MSKMSRAKGHGSIGKHAIDSAAVPMGRVPQVSAAANRTDWELLIRYETVFRGDLDDSTT